MDSAKPHTLGSIATRIVFTLVGLLLLYVLSTGPVNYAIARYHPSNPLVQNYSAPLEWVIRGTPLSSTVGAYIAWCYNLGDEHYQKHRKRDWHDVVE